MTRRRSRAPGPLPAIVLVVVALLAGGCGAEAGPEPGGIPEAGPGPSGSLVVALAATPGPVDPLLARSRGSRLLTRQIHEPLVARLGGAFGNVRERNGLARAWRSNAAGTLWTFRLRRGVEFQDGTPFDGRAVVANVERWIDAGLTAQILPELIDADFPRPDIARLFLSASVPDLDEQLGDPRFGLVSPNAFTSRLAGSRLTRATGTGTGPFELRDRDRSRVILARSAGWWGQRYQLGPGVDQIELRTIASPRRRVNSLLAGAVDIADDLGARSARRVGRDPLSTVLAAPDGTAVGISRAVRGIDSTAVNQSLSDVWLTTIDR